MKKGIRILLLLATVITLMLTATSCLSFLPSAGEGDGGTGEGGGEGENKAEAVKITVVVSDGVNTSFFNEVKTQLESRFDVSVSLTGKETLITDEKNVIYVGEFDSSVYAQARQRLSRLDTNDKNDRRYAVYTLNGASAIAFEDDGYGVNAALNTAIEALLEDGFDSKGNIRASSGVVEEGVVNTVEYQREIDEETTRAIYEELYNSILEKSGGDKIAADEVFAELKKLYSLYDDGLISWMANLYDPEIGGFYYSNSARDTVGYLPDVESTGQAFSIMVSSGLCPNAEIPQWVADAVVRYVKSLQDPNGYFYHPQWGKEATDANTTRRSRDVGKAVGVLNRFGAQPTYDTPTGVKGDGIKYDGTLVSRLSDRPSSRVIATSLTSLMGSVSYEGTYLESLATFKAWLGTLDFNSTSYQNYSMSNHLSTQTGEIKARDEMLTEKGEGGLVKALTDWMESQQNPETGLFTRLDYADIDGVNGLFKISSIYSALELPMKYPVAALESIMAVLETITPEETVRIADIFNVWSTFDNIKANVKKYNNDSADKEGTDEFFENLVKNSALAIRNSTLCLSAFVKPDGSMSWSQDFSASTSQGMPVAVPNSREGDMNAVALGGVGTVEGIMDMLGFKRIRFYTTGDKILFLSLLEDVSPVIKHEAPASEPIDFEYDEIGDECTSVDTTDLKSGGHVLVCENPDGGNALLFKTVAGTTDYVLFASDSAAFNSSCLIYESDLRITSDSTGTAFQIQLHPSVYMLGFNVLEDGSIRLTEQSQNSGASGVTNDLGVIAKTDEWFKLRVEYYPGESDQIRVKIFIDGEIHAVTDNYYGKLKNGESIPRKQFTHVRFIGLSARNAELMMDNVLVTNGKTEYSPETAPEGAVEGGIAMNVDSPDREKEVYSLNSATLPTGVSVSGEGYELDGALSLYSGTANFVVNKRSAQANVSKSEMTLSVDRGAPVGTAYELSYSDLYGNYILKLHLVVETVGGAKTLSLYEATATARGGRIGGFSAPLDESFTLNLEHFIKEGAVLISVDGKLTAVTSALLASADRYRFSYFNVKRIDTLGGENAINMQTLVVERVVKDFAEATSPEGEEKIYDFNSDLGDAIASGGVKQDGGAVSFASAKGKASLTIPLNRRSETGGDALVYFDGAFAVGAKNNQSFDVSFKSEGNILVSFRFIYSDGSLSVCELTENKVHDSIVSFPARSFNLKIEYYADEGITEVSAGGKLILRSSLVYSDYVGTADSVIISSTGAVAFSVDNLACEVYDRIYVKGAYDLKNQESSKSELGFESATTDSVPSTVTTEFRSPGGSLKVVESERDGEYGKALELTTKAGGNDSLLLAVTEKVDGATKVSFSFDFMSKSLVDADGLEIYLNVGSNSVNKITMKHSGSEILFYGKGSGGDMVFTVNAPLSEWMSLEVVYSYVDGVALTEFYLDGELVGSNDAVIVSSISVTSITKAEIYTLSASDCSYYFDNMSLKQSK